MLMRREVERQAEQVVAQSAGHELVDLVAALDGHAAHDGSCALVVSDRDRLTQNVFVLVEEHRIEECLDEAEVAGRCKLPSAPMRGMLSVSIE